MPKLFHDGIIPTNSFAGLLEILRNDKEAILQKFKRLRRTCFITDMSYNAFSENIMFLEGQNISCSARGTVATLMLANWFMSI